MPLVSVIVPNYNHAPYLRQRLDSIFNQTFQDFEVIILDDCSTDNSKEVIEEYRNRSQVSHVVYNETNSGSPFKQWAKGFDFAQGEYIWIAESDDWAELNFLEELVPILDSNPDVVLAYCAINIVYNKEPTIIRSTYSKDTFVDGKSFIKSKMVDENAVYNASCALFKKKSLQKLSTDYQKYKGCGDWLFWIEICQYGNVYFSSKKLDYFRQHEHNTTASNAKFGNCFFEMWNIYHVVKQKKLLTFFHRLEMPLICYEKCKKNSPHIADLWKQEIHFPLISKIIYNALFTLWKIKDKLF